MFVKNTEKRHKKIQIIYLNFVTFQQNMSVIHYIVLIYLESRQNEKKTLIYFFNILFEQLV